jgi:hypothetical protein
MKLLRWFMAVAVLLGVGYAVWSFRAPAQPAAPEPVANAPATAPKPMVPGLAPPRSAVAAPLAPPVVVAAQQSSPVPAAVPSDTGGGEPQPQQDLDACIAQTLKILDAKDIPGLIKTLMPPDEIQKMIASGQAASVEDIAAHFGQMPNLDEKITQLQQTLESVKGQAPEFNADGTQATYQIIDPSVTTGPGGAPGNIVFIKVDGSWYLR